MLHHNKNQCDLNARNLITLVPELFPHDREWAKFTILIYYLSIFIYYMFGYYRYGYSGLVVYLGSCKRSHSAGSPLGWNTRRSFWIKAIIHTVTITITADD
jgi:hypothetical protein